MLLKCLVRQILRVPYLRLISARNLLGFCGVVYDSNSTEIKLVAIARIFRAYLSAVLQSLSKPIGFCGVICNWIKIQLIRSAETQRRNEHDPPRKVHLLETRWVGQLLVLSAML